MQAPLFLSYRGSQTGRKCQENLLRHRGRKHRCYIPWGGGLAAEQEQNPCLQGPVDNMQWAAGGRDRRTNVGDVNYGGGVRTDAYSSSLLPVSLCSH